MESRTSEYNRLIKIASSLSHYGVDNFSTILNKLSDLLEIEDEEAATNRLKEYYERVRRQDEE